jgi:hypothetical protein
LRGEPSQTGTGPSHFGGGCRFFTGVNKGNRDGPSLGATTGQARLSRRSSRLRCRSYGAASRGWRAAARKLVGVGAFVENWAREGGGFAGVRRSDLLPCGAGFLRSKIRDAAWSVRGQIPSAFTGLCLPECSPRPRFPGWVRVCTCRKRASASHRGWTPAWCLRKSSVLSRLPRSCLRTTRFTRSTRVFRCRRTWQ